MNPPKVTDEDYINFIIATAREVTDRQINVNRSGLQAVADAGLTGGDRTIVWLKGFGQIKVFRVRATDGASEYWATSLEQVTEVGWEIAAKSAWQIEMYHRALKQECLKKEISSGAI